MGFGSLYGLPGEGRNPVVYFIHSRIAGMPAKELNKRGLLRILA